jgi:hypothetical protein
LQEVEANSAVTPPPQTAQVGGRQVWV